MRAVRQRIKAASKVYPYRERVLAPHTHTMFISEIDPTVLVSCNCNCTEINQLRILDS